VPKGLPDKIYEIDPPTSWELYDVLEDLFELNNLYENPEYSLTTEELRKKASRDKD